MEQTIKGFLELLEKRLQQYNFELNQSKINDADLDYPIEYSELDGSIYELTKIIELYKTTFNLKE